MALGVDLRRIELPSVDRRTLVGIALAALASVAVLVATRPAPTVPVLVATSDLAAGVPLAELDVGVREVADPTGLVVGDDIGELSGWVLARPVAAGEPIVPSLLRPPETVSASATMALSLEATHAVLGRLSPGDLVDVYVTTGGPGEDKTTVRVATDVYLVDATLRPSSVGGDRVDLVVAVDDPLAATLTSAAAAGTIDLVRVGP